MKRLLMLLLMIFSLATAYAQFSTLATPVIRTIARAEYFFETDPGVGNGFPITVASPADTVNFTTNIPLSGLSTGFHILQMRVCDINGMWSMTERRFFYISSNTTTNTTN